MDTLSNLPRHIRYEICEYLNFESRLSLMLTTKDWNEFIWNAPGLCPRLCITEATKSHDLKNIDRQFTSIKISFVELQNEILEELSELLTRNAGYLDELILRGLSPSDNVILLLNVVPKVKNIVLEMSPYSRRVDNDDIPKLFHTFPKLESLVVDSRHSCWVDAFMHVFEDTAKHLNKLELYNLRKRDLCIYNQEYSIKTWKILHNKPNLKIFKIYSSYYEDFQVDLSKIQFQLSEISYYSKGGGPKLHNSIKNFKKFIKTQSSIESFDINIANKGEIGEMKWNLNALLTHILSLATLKSFGIGLGDVTDLSIFSGDLCLTKIEEFKANDINSELYLRFFPNLKKIHYRYEACLSDTYTQLNQLQYLEDMHLEASLKTKTLAEISLPKLKKFHCESLINFNSKDFEVFLKSNPSLESLKIEKMIQDHIQILNTLTKAPSRFRFLEITQIFKHDCNFEIIEIIGQKMKNLSSLKMGFLSQVLKERTANGLPCTNKTEVLEFIDKAKKYLHVENPFLCFELTLLDEMKLNRDLDLKVRI